MNRKIWKGLGLVLLTLSLVFLFSCEEEGLSKTERADAFIADLNTSSRSGIGNNFTGVLSVVNASSFETGPFNPANQPFSYTKTVSGDSVTGTLYYGSPQTDITLTLSMEKTVLGGLTGGEDWKIDGITMSGGFSFP